MPDSFNLSDVMISYSRKDKDFVQQLTDALKQNGREVWVDFDDIPYSAEWWQEIEAGIEGANAFIFVISPDSINSDVCRREIDHAIKHNKRLIPILRRELTEAADRKAVHPAVASRNWIFFRETDKFDDALRTLLRTLDADLSHIQLHTRLLVRAREWDGKKRRGSLLLRGDDLQEAEKWLAEGIQRDPPPTELQIQFITASRKGANRFRRIIGGAMAAALVIVSILAVVAYNQSLETEKALQQANVALTQVAMEADARGTAQAEAIKEADARATQAVIALNNEATARVAEGIAKEEADNAATAAKDAQENAATATVARGQAQIEAGNARNSAATAQANATRAAENANEAATRAVEAAQNEQTAVAAAATSARRATESAENANAAMTAQFQAEQNEATATVAQGAAEEESRRARALALATASKTALAEGNRPLALQRALLAYSLRPDLAEVQSALYEASFSSGLRYRFSLDDVRVEFLSFSDDGARALGRDGSKLLAYSLTSGLPVTPAPGDAARSARLHTADGGLELRNMGLNLILVDTASGDVLRTFTHTEMIGSAEFSPDGRRIISGLRNGRVHLWDVQTGIELHRFTGHIAGIRSAAFNNDGTLAVSVSDDGSVRVWDLRSLSPSNFSSADTPAGFGALLAFSPDGRLALSAIRSAPYQVYVWDVSTRAPLAGFPAVASDSVQYGLFSPDGSRVWYGTFTDAVIKNLDTGDTLPLAVEKPYFLQAAAWSPDGRWLLTTGYDDVILLDASNGAERHRFTRFASPAQRVAFSPDSQTVFFTRGSRLEIWDISTDPPRQINGAEDAIRDEPVVVYQDTQVFTGQRDGVVRLWDVMTGQTIKTLLGHREGIGSLALSPDKKLIAAASYDRTLRVWDVETRQNILTITSADALLRIGFTPDGRRVYGLDAVNNTLLQWTVPDLSGGIESLIQQTCSEYALPPISEDEQAQFNLDDGEGCEALGLVDQGGGPEAVVMAATTPEAAVPVGAAALLPASLEAENAAVYAPGGWERRDDPAASGGAYLVNTSPDSSAPLSLDFTGAGVVVSFVRDLTFGAFAVEIDGAIIEAGNAGGETATFGQIAVAGLDDAPHTLRILPLAARVGIDSFTIQAAPVQVVAAPTAEAEAAVEVSPEAAVETSPEVTPEVTVETSPEATVALEVTPEASPEATAELSATSGWVLTGDGWYISAGPSFNALDIEQPVDLSDGHPRQLTFRSLLRVADLGGSVAAVQASADGENWMLLQTIPPADLWTDVVVDLPAYAGQMLRLRFVWFFTPPDVDQPPDFWLVDAIQVRDAIPPTETPTETPSPTLEIATVTPSPSETPTLPPLPTEPPAPEVLPTAPDTPTPVYTEPYFAPDGSVWIGEGGWTLADGIFVAGETYEQASITRQENIGPTADGWELRFQSLLNAPEFDGSFAAVEISLNGGEWQPVIAVPPSPDWTPLTFDLSLYKGLSVRLRLAWYYVPPVEGRPADSWSVTGFEIVPVAPTPEMTVETTPEATAAPITEFTAEPLPFDTVAPAAETAEPPAEATPEAAAP